MKRCLSLILPILVLAFAAAVSGQPLPSLSELADKAYREGYDHHIAGRYDEAIDAYSRSIRIRATNPSVWFNRGLVHQRMAADKPSTEAYLKAIADFTEALKLKPGEPDYLISRADCYHVIRSADIKKYPQLAIADYTEYLKLKPSDAGAFTRRAEAYEEAGETQKAIADLTKAVTLDPRDKEAFFRRGTIRFNNALPGAKEDFETALRIDPSHPFAGRWLANLNAREVQKSAPQTTQKVTSKPVAVVAKVNPPPSRTADKPAGKPGPAARSDPARVIEGDWATKAELGKKRLTAGDVDAAIANLKAAEAVYPPAPTDSTFSKLQWVRIRAKNREHLANAYILKKDYKTALDLLSETGTEYLGVLNDDLEDINVQLARTPLNSLSIVLYTERLPAAKDLFEISKRGFEALRRENLPDDLKMKLLVLGFLKIGVGEVYAVMFQNIALSRLRLGELCRTGVCDPGKSDRIHANDGLLHINEAIAIAPAVKELYSTRARIHRFLGDTAAAAADEAKAQVK